MTKSPSVEKNQPMGVSNWKKYLDYDRNTGVFRWKVAKSRNIKVGQVAGGMDVDGYLVIRIDGRGYAAHRLAWLFEYGKWPEQEIDHINHLKTDNSISNLQDVSRTINIRRRLLFKNNKSNISGVRQDGKFWRAEIGMNGGKLWLGQFPTKEEAVKAREDAESIYYLDFPIGVTQWRNFGIRMGYWEYFRNEVRREVVEEIQREADIVQEVKLESGVRGDISEFRLVRLDDIISHLQSDKGEDEK